MLSKVKLSKPNKCLCWYSTTDILVKNNNNLKTPLNT